MNGINLSCEFDAQVWAKEWMRITKENPSIPTDEGTMLGWFANSIMAGYDHAKNDGRIMELQSTITAQEDIIKRLREDAERLSQNHWYENEEDGKEYCNMCGFPFKKQFSEHDDDCPITLHTQLMNELGEKQ